MNANLADYHTTEGQSQMKPPRDKQRQGSVSSILAVENLHNGDGN
jgi:hypothetical protein